MGIWQATARLHRGVGALPEDRGVCLPDSCLVKRCTSRFRGNARSRRVLTTRPDSGMCGKPASRPTKPRRISGWRRATRWCQQACPGEPADRAGDGGLVVPASASGLTSWWFGGSMANTAGLRTDQVIGW